MKKFIVWEVQEVEYGGYVVEAENAEKAKEKFDNDRSSGEYFDTYWDDTHYVSSVTEFEEEEEDD